MVLAAALVMASTGAALAQDATPARACSSECASPVTTPARARRSSSARRSTGSTAARPAPSPGFNYSDANKNSGITWSDATFTEYIKNPMQRMPGTRMAFAGVRDEKDIDEPVGLPQAVRRERQQEVSLDAAPLNPAEPGLPRKRYPRARSRSDDQGPRRQSRRRRARAGRRRRLCDLGGARPLAPTSPASAFVYEPVIPGSLLGGIPTDLIEVQREENAKAAKAASPASRPRPRPPASRPRPACSTPASPAPPTCSAASPGASTSPWSGRRSASRAPRKSC